MSKKPQSAIDGISNNPKHAITALVPYTDWAALERAFILNETHPRVASWLNEVLGWRPTKIRSGQTIEKTKGWGKKRDAFQMQITQNAIEEALSLERKNVPTLRAAKAALIANIVKDVGRWDRLNMMDKKLCYEILKVELREPTNVKDLPPAGAKDPVEALLEEFGLMADGEIIIDDEPATDSLTLSSADSDEAAKPDSKASVEVPQD
jgi:hypothetical protein